MENELDIPNQMNSQAQNNELDTSQKDLNRVIKLKATGEELESSTNAVITLAQAKANEIHQGKMLHGN